MSTAVIDQTSYAAEAPKRRIHAPITFRELLTPVFYYKRRALIAFLIPVILALVAALLAHKTYTAQSRLLILLGGEYVFKTTADAGQAQVFDRPQIVHAEMEILGARSLREATLAKVGLARVYPNLARQPNGMDLAVDAFEKDLTVNNVPTSNVVELSFRARDPKVSAEVLNTLVELYLARRVEVFNRGDSGQARAQRDVLARALAAAESRITDFSTRYGFGDYAQEFNAVQAQQSALQAQLQGVDQQIATRSARAVQLSAIKGSTPREVQVSTDHGRSAQLDALTQNLVALQAQRREAAEKYQDGYPLVADLDQRIANVQAQIRQAPAQQVSVERRGVNPVHQQIDTELADSQGDVAGLRNGRRALQVSLDQTNRRLAELVRIGPEYRELVRQRTLAEGAYDELMRSTAAAEVDNAIAKSRANIKIVQPAEPPAKGKAGRLILLILGVAVGGAAAFATVVLSQATSEVMVTPGDVEDKLDIPVLAAAPMKAKAPATPGRLAPAYLGVDEGRLLLRLLSSLPKDRGRVMQLVASHDGEGVSSLTRDLAVIAAAGGARRVLLVDIEPAGGKGAAQAFAEQNHTLHPTSEERRAYRVGDSTLYVSAPIGAGGLEVDETKWARIIEAARSTFDLVLVDSPAIQRSSAAIEVAALTDITLAVVEAETTRVAVARRLVERIEAAGGQVVGAVLNKREFYIPRFIYKAL